MGQRWMEAKMILGAKHGFARSGAGRAMGAVLEDRNVGRPEDKNPGKITARVRNVVLVPTVERRKYDAAPPAWKRPRGYVAR